MTWLEHRGVTPRMLSELAWRGRYRLRQRLAVVDLAAYLVALTWLAIMGWLLRRPV